MHKLNAIYFSIGTVGFVIQLGQNADRDEDGDEDDKSEYRAKRPGPHKRRIENSIECRQQD